MSYQPNLLASYAYIKGNLDVCIQNISELKSSLNILIDSGGFTDYWNSIKSAALGKKLDKIDVDDYIKFCHAVKDNVWGYIQLDKPRDAARSLELLNRQCSAGLKPIPVFTQDMPWAHLLDLIEINDRVCISAGWQSSTEYSHQRYQKAYKLTNGKVKSHALAWGRYPQILGLPIASADSSTWLNGGKYGSIKVFERPYKLPSITRDKLVSAFNQPIGNKFLSKLLLYNVTIEDMNDARQWRVTKNYPSLSEATHAYAFLQVMKYIKVKQGIDYFLVVDGFGKSTYNEQLMATLFGVKEDGNFDYQLYKSEIGKLKYIDSEEKFLESYKIALARYEYIL